jgi:hypothetical protein
MEEKVKRGRGRPPKIKPVEVAIKAPVQKDALLSLVQQKFMDAYGFETTEAQSKHFLLSLVAQIEL